MSAKPFDFLIVGAGLFGAVMARELTDKGLRVLVVEKRNHIAGQCYTTTRDGIVTCEYGGHVFHTNDRRLWDYANRFAHFLHFRPHVKAIAGDRVYSFPPNKMMYQQLGENGHTREVVRRMFFEGYTAKMWGRPIDQVPASVLARIPMRDDWNDEYLTDKYQGLPEGGYTPMVERVLSGIDVQLDVDYLAERAELKPLAERVIYSGPIDALFDYDAGPLEWRGIRFEHWLHEGEVYQGCESINYCDIDVPWLRDQEWKYFWKPGARLPYSWVTRSFPDTSEPLYPVNDDANNKRADEYQERARLGGYILGGRLASYKYFDMHQVIAQALSLVERLVG